MSKNLYDDVKVAGLVVAAVTADSDNSGNDTGTGVDMFGARDGMLVISTTKLVTGIDSFGLYTSDIQAFSPGTTNVVTITQDVSNSTGSLTQTSNVISAIATTGVYVYHAQNLERYVRVKYDGNHATDALGVNLIGLNLEQSPAPTSAKSAY